MSEKIDNEMSICFREQPRSKIHSVSVSNKKRTLLH